MKKMILLGDSISLHYGPFLAEYLKGEYRIYSKPGVDQALKDIDNAVCGNGGDSFKVLEYIKERDSRNDLEIKSNCQNITDTVMTALKKARKKSFLKKGHITWTAVFNCLAVNLFTKSLEKTMMI